jgi:hypothetical protein
MCIFECPCSASIMIVFSVRRVQLKCPDYDEVMTVRVRNSGGASEMTALQLLNDIDCMRQHHT